MAYEDITTFTEVDAGGYWSQTATRSKGSSVPQNDDSYVYKDYGAGYFGDYIHHVDICMDNSGPWPDVTGSSVGLWAVTNGFGSYSDMTEGQTIRVGKVGLTSRRVWFEDIGAATSASYTFATVFTAYLIIERNGTTATCKIYSDAARTSLLTTLTITCQTTTFRYLQAGFSEEGLNAWRTTGYSENFDINPVNLELDDIDTDIRFAHSGIEDISSDVRFYPYNLEQKDILTDIRINYQVLSDILTDIRFTDEIEVISDIESDIRFFNANLQDINTDIRFYTINTVFGDINCDIRFGPYINALYDINTKIEFLQGQYTEHLILVNEVYVVDGKYHSNNNVTLAIDVDNATHMQFKIDSGAWSGWEAYATSKSITLPSSDGTYKIYYWFKNAAGYSDRDAYKEVVLQITNPAFPTINCQTEEGGSTITSGVWQADATPYFYWNVANWDFPVLGYSVSLDGTPNDDIDITVGHILINGGVASKGSGNWDVDLTTLKYQNRNEVLSITADTYTLSAAHATLNRYDIIYLDLTDDTIKIKEGTPSASPADPDIDEDHLKICKILVRGGDTQIYNGDITDLRDFKIEYEEYISDPIAAGDHNFRVKALSFNDIESAVGVFNLRISSQNYDISPLRVYEDNSLAVEFENGKYQTVTDTPYLTWSNPSPVGSTVTYYITIDGTEPSLTNYQWTTTNLYYDITSNLGAGITTIKVKPIDNFGTGGTTQTFTFVYGTTNITNTLVVIINGTVYDQLQKEVQVHNVIMSLNSPWTCTFSLPDKRFDETISINNDDEVQVIYKDVLVFNGWIKEIRRLIGDNGETINCRAIDSRGILTETTWVTGGSSFHEYLEPSYQVKDRFNDVLDDIPSYLVASSTGVSQLNNSIGEAKYAAAKITTVLDELIEKAGNYKYYINQNKVLKIVNLASCTPHNLYLGVLGQHISAHKHEPSQSGDYDIVANDLNFSTLDNYTRVVIEGAREQYQDWFRCAEYLSPDDERSTHFSIAVPTGYKLLGSLYDPPGESAKLWTTWSRTTFFNCLAIWPHPVIEYETYNMVVQGSIDVQNNTGSVGVVSRYLANDPCDFPAPGYYLKEGTVVAGPVPDRWCTSTPANVWVYTAYEKPERITVSVGDASASIENTLYILDESYKFQYNYRDDTSEMTEYANKILAAKNYVKIKGQIVLDQIYTDITLDNCINVYNSAQSSWQNLQATILAITFDFDRNSTRLDLTTEYIGGIR